MLFVPSSTPPLPFIKPTKGYYYSSNSRTLIRLILPLRKYPTLFIRHDASFLIDINIFGMSLSVRYLNAFIVEEEEQVSPKGTP